MSFVCHSSVICKSIVCNGMAFVCTRMSSVFHSYIVTRMCSFVIHMSFICTGMSSVCHSYVLVCHPYVTRMDSYVIRMLLLFGFTMNLPLKLDENVKLQLNL